MATRGNDRKLNIDDYYNYIEQYKKVGFFPNPDKKLLESDNQILNKINNLDDKTIGQIDHLDRTECSFKDNTWYVWSKTLWSR